MQAVAPANDDIAAMTDLEIAQRIVAGDRLLLAALMRRYNQILYRTARSILKDDAEAEDAVQEAYLLAFKAMAGFRAEAKMSTWLVRIVVNESLGRLRKQNRRAEVVWLSADRERDQEIADEPMSQASHGQPERDVLRSQTRRLIEASIDKLPDSFRTVFVLRAVEELSVEETAEALGIPEATVRTRFFRARSLLREALAREIEFCIDGAFGFAGGRCDRIVAKVLARIDEP